MAVTAETTKADRGPLADLHQPLADAEIEAILRPALDAVDPLAEPENGSEVAAS